MSVPRNGIKIAVPETFDEFPVTVERSEKVIDDSCFEFFRGNALLRCVDDASGKVERLPALGVYTNDTERHVVKEYGIFDVYRNRESEVVVFSICTNHIRAWDMFCVFKDAMLVKYRRNSADVADSVNITFIDGIYGAQDVLNFDETFPYRPVSCEGFGYPKPVVSIEHEAGRSLPTVELKQSSGMSTHVTASLDDVSLNEAVGKYICTVTAGSKTVSKTTEVKKVIRPEILVADVFINNTEEIIAVCIARGQPAPKISFSVNYAKKDKIEKRPVLETERTVKRTHVSKYKAQGGLSVDSWFESKAERFPKPDSITMKKSLHDSDVTKRMIAIKPLPYLSRQRVDLLYCRAEGFDNVFVTKEVTADISWNIRRFMTHVNNLAFLKVFAMARFSKGVPVYTFLHTYYV